MPVTTANNSITYVTTPIGLLPSSCVHQVPNSSTVLPNGTVISSQGIRTTFHLCSQSAQPAVPASGSYPPSWDMWAWAQDALGVSKFDGYWTVPSSPQSKDSQTLYLWIGTECCDAGPSGDQSPLLQPALRYFGYPYGGDYWDAESWICYSATDCWNTPTLSVKQGDTIYGGVDWVYNPQLNEYGWQITTRDGTHSSILFAGTFSGFQNIMTDLYVNFEAYHVKSCSDYPNVPYTTFSPLSTVFSPSWSAEYGVTHGCHENVLINSPSSVSLEYDGQA